MADIKQVIAVRTDLGMGKGKIAAQVGHACVMGAEHVRKSHPEWFQTWWTGQEKVVVKVSGIKELDEVEISGSEQFSISFNFLHSYFFVTTTPPPISWANCLVKIHIFSFRFISTMTS